MGAAIQCLYAHPVATSVSRGFSRTSFSVASVRLFSRVLSPRCLLPDMEQQATSLPMDDNGTMTLAFEQQPVSATNVSVVLMEDLTHGQLIGNFTLECLVSSNTSSVLNSPTWEACPMGEW